MAKVVEKIMHGKLMQLTPSYLRILNESYMHNVKKGSETHFKVIVVSNQFETKSEVERHRLINNILRDELKSGVHALSIIAKTPSQWHNEDIEASPVCKGGFKQK